MKKITILTLICLTLLSMTSDDIQRKQIRQKEYDIECYVYIKQLNKFDDDKEYFWFKSGEVHNSFANAGGLVLHEDFKKYYRSKQLAEQGIFDYGLKDGEWRDWYENGKIKSITNWNKGYKSGKYYLYDELGDLVISGSYKKSVRANKWINHKTADTTYYKNDSIYDEKPKSKVSKFFTKIFSKRDSVEVAKKRQERLERRKQDSIERFLKKQKRKEKRKQDSIRKTQQIKD